MIKSAVPFTAEERKAVAVFSLLLFLVVSAFVILKSARDALFLSTYSAGALPYFMILNTIVSALAAALTLKLYGRFTLLRIVRISFPLFSLGTMLVWLTSRYDFLPALLYLWVGIVGTIAPVQAWSLISQRIGTRQARRWMGWMGAGAILGSVAGGTLARSLVHIGGVHVLIPLAGFLLFLAALVCEWLPPASQETAQASIEPSDPSPVRRQFVILLLCIVAVGTVVSTFVDFQFKILAQREFHDARMLAHFFGSFYAIMGIVTLLMQVAVTPFLMRRFGIPATLPMLPFTMFIANVALLFTGAFGAAIVMRGSEEALRFSVDRSSLEILYVALPEKIKVRLKSWIDTLGTRVPEGIASLVLISLFSLNRSHLTLLTQINAGLLILWFVCAIVLGRREYPRMLQQKIHRKEIDFEHVKENLFNNDFYRLLPELFRSAEKETVLSLLDLLETSGNRWLGRYLAITLEHADPEIRRKSLQILFDQDANLSHQVQRMLNDKVDTIRMEAVHYLCCHSRLDDALRQKLEKEGDLPVRVALTAYHSKGSTAVLQKLNDLFEEASGQSQEQARIEIAHVLRYLNPSEAGVPLYKRLLTDPSIEVRRAAIRSAGATKLNGVITLLLKLSRQPALRSDVRSALSQYGPLLLPLLVHVIQNPSESIAAKKLAVKVASDIGGRGSLNLILHAASEKNLALRFNAIKALNRLKNDRSLEPSEGQVMPLLVREMETAAGELERAQAFIANPGGILETIVKQRIHWAFERIFRLLALLYPSDIVYSAYHAWIHEDPQHRDTALELLEHTIIIEIREKLFPLLESYPNFRTANLNPRTRREAFQSFLAEDEPILGAAAIADLDDAEAGNWLDKTDLQKYPALVQETLIWRYRQMEDTNRPPEQQALTTIQKMEQLNKVDVFSGLGTPELLLLAEHAKEIQFQRDELIFQEGEPASAFFILLSGEIVQTRTSKVIAAIHPGDCFGMQDLLIGKPYSSSAVATSAASCLRLSKDGFWDILEDYSSVSHGIIEKLVQRVQTLTDQLALKTTPNPKRKNVRPKVTDPL